MSGKQRLSHSAKHTKKYMKKGIDVSDIEQARQDQWLDERLGFAVAIATEQKPWIAAFK